MNDSYLAVGLLYGGIGVRREEFRMELYRMIYTR